MRSADRAFSLFTSQLKWLIQYNFMLRTHPPQSLRQETPGNIWNLIRWGQYKLSAILTSHSYATLPKVKLPNLSSSHARSGIITLMRWGSWYANEPERESVCACVCECQQVRKRVRERVKKIKIFITHFSKGRGLSHYLKKWLPEETLLCLYQPIQFFCANVVDGIFALRSL